MSVKKILALLLAAMMVFGMTSALAAEADPTNGYATTTAQVDSITIPLRKGFIAQNDYATIGSDPVMINFPSITYSYEITPADTTGISVTDAAENTVAVKPGVIGAISATTGVTVDTTNNKADVDIVIDAGHVTLTSKTAGSGTVGQELVMTDTDVTISATPFGAPGIYRFKITEATTNDDARVNAGIVKSTASDKDYFLDVYVGYKTHINSNNGVDTVVLDDPKVLVINGAVLLSENKDVDGDTDTDPATKVPAEDEDKESGLDDLPDDPVPTDPSDDDDTDYKLASGVTDALSLDKIDIYYTYNVKLIKNVTGAMGDTSNKFPFTFTVVNDTNATAAEHLVWGSQGNTSTTDADANATDYDYDKTASQSVFYLKHEEYAQLIGLNPYATIKVKEQNNTESVYTVTATDDASTPNTLDETKVAKDEFAELYTNAMEIRDFNADSEADKLISEITYTNDLPQISPTGVVLRFAPYFAMFAAGCALFLILATKRSKKEEE